MFLAVEAFLLLSEVLAGYYPGIPTDAVHQLFSGRYAPGFAVEVIVGLVIPFVLLAVAAWRRRPQVVVVASVLALIGIFVHRANLIVIGLGKDPIALPPGTPLGTPQADGSSFAVSSVYFPVGLGVPDRARDRRPLRAAVHAGRALSAAQGEDAGLRRSDQDEANVAQTSDAPGPPSGGPGASLADVCAGRAAVYEVLAYGFSEPAPLLSRRLRAARSWRFFAVPWAGFAPVRSRTTRP